MCMEVVESSSELESNCVPLDMLYGFRNIIQDIRGVIEKKWSGYLVLVLEDILYELVP